MESFHLPTMRSCPIAKAHESYPTTKSSIINPPVPNFLVLLYIILFLFKIFVLEKSLLVLYISNIYWNTALHNIISPVIRVRFSDRV
jgi:hypothetical protein